MNTTTRLLACFAGAALLCAVGCNIVGPALYLAHGPEKVPAVFTLPKDRSAVIVIDDRASVVPQRSLRDTIGKSAEEEILAQRLVREMIAARLASAVMARERRGEPMGIAEIGQAVNADAVIYVRMDRFSLSEDGQSLTPIATGKVKVVDSKTGVRLGPPENAPIDAYDLVVRLPAQGMTGPTTANELAMLQNLARVTGVYLSRMFYDAEKMSEPTKLQEK